MSRHNPLSRSAVLARPLHLSSPRKRGPIRRVVAMGHDRRTTGHAGVMGPRLRGDDSREAVRNDDSREGSLNIESLGLKMMHDHFPCSRARNCRLPFYLSRTLSAYSAHCAVPALIAGLSRIALRAPQGDNAVMGAIVNAAPGGRDATFPIDGLAGAGRPRRFG